MSGSCFTLLMPRIRSDVAADVMDDKIDLRRPAAQREEKVPRTSDAERESVLYTEVSESMTAYKLQVVWTRDRASEEQK